MRLFTRFPKWPKIQKINASCWIFKFENFWTASYKNFEFWHITKLIEPPYRHIRSHVVVMKQKISTNLFDEEDPFSCLRLDRVSPSCCGIWNNFCRGHFESAPCWGRSYKDCMFCRLVIPNGGSFGRARFVEAEIVGIGLGQIKQICPIVPKRNTRR